MSNRCDLKLETLGLLNDGLASKGINGNLSAAIRDCEERGLADGKTRKVLIEVNLLAVTEGEVAVTISSHWKGPKYVTDATITKLGMSAQGPTLGFEMSAAQRDEAEVDE